MSGSLAGEAPTGAAPATVLWLVRHGHTLVHGTGGVAGRSDVALSDRGRSAIGALGETLGGALACRPASPRWFASPLERARETATILRAACGARTPLALDARLVELDFGDWEGSTWETVHRDHGAELAAWGEDWVRGAPPGGETFAAQLARCGAWLDAVTRRRSSTDTDTDTGEPGDESRDAIVVAHGGSIRALLCRLLGHPPETAMRYAIDPARVCRVERDARLAGGWRLASANVGDFDP